MKNRIILLAAILTFAACSKDDGNITPDNIDESKISFVKMANCPVAADLCNAVYNGLIYYASATGDFISYNPATNEWKTLARITAATIRDYNLFVWNNRLYWYGYDGYQNSNIQTYNIKENSWVNADDIKLSESYTTRIFNLGDTLFAFAQNGVYVYNQETHKWSFFSTWSDNTIDTDFCCVGDLWLKMNVNRFYGETYKQTITQLNKSDYTLTEKLSIQFTHKDSNISPTIEYSRYNQVYMIYIRYSIDFVREYVVGIYNPANNEYNETEINNFPFQLSSRIGAKIRLTVVNNHIFVGPYNSQFYELKIK